MIDWQPLLAFLHIAAVVAWVGGMFFAHLCLRPVAAQQLASPLRLPLMAGVFSRFFPWVWVSSLTILASGLAMMLRTGFAVAPLRWHLMMGLGIVMTAIFSYIFFAPYARLKRGVARQDWPAAAAALNRIRSLVGVNLSLGYLTLSIAVLGRYLPD